jgi:hypothetical protein
VEEMSSIVIEEGCVYRLEPKSKLKIDRSSKLIVNGTLIVGDGAQVFAKSKNGIVNNGGNIVIEGKGKVK